MTTQGDRKKEMKRGKKSMPFSSACHLRCLLDCTKLVSLRSQQVLISVSTPEIPTAWATLSEKRRKPLEMMLIPARVTVFWWKSFSSDDYVYWEQAHFTPSAGQHRSWQRQGPWHMRSSELLTWGEEENINGWMGLWWCMQRKQNEHCRVTPPPLLFSLQCQTQPGMPIQPWSKTGRNMLFSPTV